MFHPTRDGFAVGLDDEAKAWVVDLAEQLNSLLDDGGDTTRRLFPTAYPDDPERDAGYQILARQELIDSRREAIVLMKETAELDVWTEEELTAWMGIVNDLRLVLGTQLDVSEDDELDIDATTPDGMTHLVYHQLGYLLSEIVDGLSRTLPPPEQS